MCAFSRLPTISSIFILQYALMLAGQHSSYSQSKGKNLFASGKEGSSFVILNEMKDPRIMDPSATRFALCSGWHWGVFRTTEAHMSLWGASEGSDVAIHGSFGYASGWRVCLRM